MRRCWMSLFAAVFLSHSILSVAQSDRVGTFDRQAIVVAYYSSPLWKATLKEKQQAMDEAKRAHDSLKIEALNAWGAESQELAEKQVAGEAPITNIIEALQPAFQEIERTDNLSSVVPAPSPDPKLQTIDVTGKLLDWLKASDSTRKIIQGLSRK